MMWFVIDMVLLLILPFRKTVTKYENVMRRRSIESVKSLGARLMDVLSKIFLLIPVGLIVYILIHIVPDMIIQKLLEWYKGIFIVALFPLLFTWIKEKNFNIKSIWNGCLTVLAILFSIVGLRYERKVKNIILKKYPRRVLEKTCTIGRPDWC